jgi:hypothetical protein
MGTGVISEELVRGMRVYASVSRTAISEEMDEDAYDEVYGRLFKKLYDSYRPRAMAAAVGMLQGQKVKSFMVKAVEGHALPTIRMAEELSKEEEHLRNAAKTELDLLTAGANLDEGSKKKFLDRFVPDFLELTVVDRMNHIAAGIVKNNKHLFITRPGETASYVMSLNPALSVPELNHIFVQLYGEPLGNGNPNAQAKEARIALAASIYRARKG